MIVDDFLIIPAPLEETKAIVTKRVYKVPDSLEIKTLKSLEGGFGSFLNPVEDLNGNWFVSQEEWNCEEFQYLKDENPDLASQFQLIEYVGKKLTPDVISN